MSVYLFMQAVKTTVLSGEDKLRKGRKQLVQQKGSGFKMVFIVLSILHLFVLDVVNLNVLYVH